MHVHDARTNTQANLFRVITRVLIHLRSACATSRCCRPNYAELVRITFNAEDVWSERCAAVETSWCTPKGTCAPRVEHLVVPVKSL
jgi:hypothetical protein